MTLDIYKSIGNTLKGLEDALRISIANADNFNTPGFKYTFASFTTVFSQAISTGTETINPQQIPGSMTLGSTSTSFEQGNISFGTNLDMAISGEGFFLLTNAPGDFNSSGENVYTRNGRFQVDFANNFLTDSFGRKVLGFELNSEGQRISDTPVPITTKGNVDIGFTEGGILVNNFQANKDGVAAGDADPPRQVPLFQVALGTVQNKQGLINIDGGALEATVAAGEAFEPDVSGNGVYGAVLSESLESSNIDVAQVALDMALLNRGFNAVQGVIDDVNKITNQLISKLAG